MTNEMNKKGLSVRDLITTGVLAALYVVCAFIGELMFGFFPDELKIITESPNFRRNFFDR